MYQLNNEDYINAAHDIMGTTPFDTDVSLSDAIAVVAKYEIFYMAQLALHNAETLYFRQYAEMFPLQVKGKCIETRDKDGKLRVKVGAL